MQRFGNRVRGGVLALNSRGVLLEEFACYGLAISLEIAIDRSMHVPWATDKTVIRATLRVDGRPLVDGPIIPRRGTDSLSVFFWLETRSQPPTGLHCVRRPGLVTLLRVGRIHSAACWCPCEA
jgi:hypothetical protein